MSNQDNNTPSTPPAGNGAGNGGPDGQDTFFDLALLGDSPDTMRIFNGLENLINGSPDINNTPFDRADDAPIDAPGELDVPTLEGWPSTANTNNNGRVLRSAASRNRATNQLEEENIDPSLRQSNSPLPTDGPGAPTDDGGNDNGQFPPPPTGNGNGDGQDGAAPDTMPDPYLEATHAQNLQFDQYRSLVDATGVKELVPLPAGVEESMPQNMRQRRAYASDMLRETEGWLHWRVSCYHPTQQPTILCDADGHAMDIFHPLRAVHYGLLIDEPGEGLPIADPIKASLWEINGYIVDYWGCLVDANHPMRPSASLPPVWTVPQSELWKTDDLQGQVPAQPVEIYTLPYISEYLARHRIPSSTTEPQTMISTMRFDPMVSLNIFDRAFPGSSKIIPNDVEGGLCGVYAIRDSWKAQGARLGLPPWQNRYTNALLNTVRAQTMAAEFSTLGDTQSHFYYEQLVSGLAKWAKKTLNRNVRLAMYEPLNENNTGMYSILRVEGYEDDESMAALWVHFEGHGESGTNHWSGLMKAGDSLEDQATQSTSDKSVDVDVIEETINGWPTREALRKRNLKRPEALHGTKRSTNRRGDKSMSKEELEVHNLRCSELEDVAFPQRYHDMGRFRRDCEIDEKVYNRNPRFCTFQDERNGIEADDTFPKSDREVLVYAAQLYEGVLDCDDFRDWSNAIVGGKGDRKKDLEKIKANLKNSNLKISRGEHIPDVARDLLPNAHLCIKRIVGVNSRISNHSVAQICIELVHACVYAQQGQLRSMTHNHHSGWESFESFADRVSAVGYTLRVLKQTLRDLTVVGTSATIKLANSPLGELIKKAANKAGNDIKGRRLKTNARNNNAAASEGSGDSSSDDANVSGDEAAANIPMPSSKLPEAVKGEIQRQMDRKRKREAEGKDGNGDTTDEEDRGKRQKTSRKSDSEEAYESTASRKPVANKKQQQQQPVTQVDNADNNNTTNSNNNDAGDANVGNGNAAPAATEGKRKAGRPKGSKNKVKNPPAAPKEKPVSKKRRANDEGDAGQPKRARAPPKPVSNKAKPAGKPKQSDKPSPASENPDDDKNKRVTRSSSRKPKD
ncbi:hypothetical protein N3K66_002944 [Trichothecium roseum]|uniref:Uncharacterized protein n=1 Tax=Trichothecium roseum TaxID=47278 RepID=A0ACC0V5T4_9HYPO|nr:hypothetical protein N3K66_002944 [Trichothecium roseum]